MLSFDFAVEEKEGLAKYRERKYFRARKIDSFFLLEKGNFSL